MSRDPNMCPRVDDTQDLGKPTKRWRKGYVNQMFAEAYYDKAGNQFTPAINILERTKEYKLGDIAYSGDLPSNLYLECNGAGTTKNFVDGYGNIDNTNLNAFVATLKNAKEGDVIGDGTVAWHVKRVGGRSVWGGDLITGTNFAMTMPPNHYSRSNMWKASSAAVLAAPNEMWVNVNDAGLVLSAPQTFNLDNDSVWDYQATEWQGDKAYALGDVVYPKTNKNGRYYKCVLAGSSSAVLTPAWTTTIGDIVNDGNVQWECFLAPTEPTARDGQAYYIYACIATGTKIPKIVISNNAEMCNSQTVSTARKIGGFSCFSSARASNTPNYNTGDIIPASVWDVGEDESGLRFVASTPRHYTRHELPTPAKTSITMHKTLVNINDSGYSIPSDYVLDLTNTSMWDDSTYANPANRVGRDFYIYVCQPVTGFVPNVILSANSTAPTGYTPVESRKIGGFHCLCADVGTITGHALSGYVAGDILPCSVWDLLHRPVAEPEGMVYDEGTGVWYDIYLASYSGGKLLSQFGGTIADGGSAVKFHGEKFAEEFGKVGKRLLWRDEFIHVAKGSNEETSIAGSADPVTTGGHKDTANRRMISNIGLEDCCGALWQWTADTHDSYDGRSTSFNSSYYYLQGYPWQKMCVYCSDVDSRSYGSCSGLLRRCIVGGCWGNGAYCGSRSAALSLFSSRVDASIGGRGASEPRVANL